MTNITKTTDVFEALGIKPSSEIKQEMRRIRKKRNARKKNLPRITKVSDVNEEVLTFRKDVGDEVILGVYGAEDWIFASMLRDRFLTGKNTIQVDGTWLIESAFKLVDFVKANFKRYSFFSSSHALCFSDDAVVKIVVGRGKIDVEIYGDEATTSKWDSFFASQFKPAESLIEWIYDARGNDITVPLNYRPAIRAAYPWISPSYKEIKDYVNEYLDSEASVLILIGPPGTGKTTFIKNLIHFGKGNAKVAYDPQVVQQDSFFANFIEDDDSKFLIMEDADEFLRARNDGNTMMHKFLNLSDGLISAADKKLVFSTNLPNIGDIDSALMRPGRCFDVLEFRHLDRTEGQAVLDEIGDSRQLPDGSKFSLAEIFSSQPSGKITHRRKVGFV